MGKYRKLPIEVEAWQVGEPVSKDNTPMWMQNALADNIIVPCSDGPFHYQIHTLEGIMKADIADWIIQGVKGELYPCKPDIFEATYEKVD